MDSKAIERLTAHAAPQRLPLDGDETREHRNWVIRLAQPVAGGLNSNELSVILSRDAASAVAEALNERGLASAGNSIYAPTVRVVVIDELHVVLNVSTIRLEQDEAHAYLVAASAALRGLERTAAIEDIQGIPRRFWRLVVGPMA